MLEGSSEAAEGGEFSQLLLSTCPSVTCLSVRSVCLSHICLSVTCLSTSRHLSGCLSFIGLSPVCLSSVFHLSVFHLSVSLSLGLSVYQLEVIGVVGVTMR